LHFIRNETVSVDTDIEKRLRGLLYTLLIFLHTPATFLAASSTYCLRSHDQEQGDILVMWANPSVKCLGSDHLPLFAISVVVVLGHSITFPLWSYFKLRKVFTKDEHHQQERLTAVHYKKFFGDDYLPEYFWVLHCRMILSVVLSFTRVFLSASNHQAQVSRLTLNATFTCLYAGILVILRPHVHHMEWKFPVQLWLLALITISSIFDYINYLFLENMGVSGYAVQILSVILLSLALLLFVILILSFYRVIYLSRSSDYIEHFLLQKDGKLHQVVQEHKLRSRMSRQATAFGHFRSGFRSITSSRFGSWKGSPRNSSKQGGASGFVATTEVVSRRIPSDSKIGRHRRTDSKSSTLSGLIIPSTPQSTLKRMTGNYWHHKPARISNVTSACMSGIKDRYGNDSSAELCNHEKIASTNAHPFIPLSPATIKDTIVATTMLKMEADRKITVESDARQSTSTSVTLMKDSSRRRSDADDSVSIEHAGYRCNNDPSIQGQRGSAATPPPTMRNIPLQKDKENVSNLSHGSSLMASKPKRAVSRASLYMNVD